MVNSWNVWKQVKEGRGGAGDRIMELMKEEVDELYVREKKAEEKVLYRSES